MRAIIAIGCDHTSSVPVQDFGRENDIDETVLPSLTHENLKELGVVSFGHRVKLLDTIAALRSDASGKPPSARPSQVPQAHIQKTAPSGVR